MPLPPVLYHIFPLPIPYLPTLALQNSIHHLQLNLRKSTQDNPDILLLLQHTPVYTAGRREVEVKELEAARLKSAGADWVKSDRGGLTTFHGPGQVVGYPLWDIGRIGMSARCYVNNVESSLRDYLQQTFSLRTLDPSPSPGLFTTPERKIASLGISVRHRLTAHGFSLNVLHEPVRWFDQVVACGLEGVGATSVQDELPSAGLGEGGMTGVAEGIATAFGGRFGRSMQRLDLDVLGGLEGGTKVRQELELLEREGRREWLREPLV
ncbi:lipoyltransferase [Dacryopinax primogenitus]|uniref:lipoyl(octanoyl) transferase n=1 Tax=Dacryopinax primogenitus (strain DJM 731) TaxID=1858805 RepID=M5G0Z5_DACPD|nr:lipoyltransferase [Dacryopinax primogenitus]EJT97457.1 lipoyltransferase [Dacryopinax primogenitus]